MELNTVLKYLFFSVACIKTGDGAVDMDEFDYIVVGAGASGSILSNRLSARYNVLLLEKGGTPNILTEVPALCPLMSSTGNGDKYLAEKQPGVGLGLVDQRPSAMRGKGLGGTSLLNHMVYLRGVREDYDRWAAAGNPGWSYDEVVPSYRRFENTRISYVDGSLRGVGGEMDVTEPTYRSGITDAFVEACKEYGLKHLRDYNDGVQYGVGYVQGNLRNGRRCHSEKAFLHDVKGRHTLTIKTGALVTKLRIDERTKTVEGVEYESGGRTRHAKAKKEVILAAGSYASPQILMLSGIGPEKHLKEMYIDVVQDLPVGKVLYDHLAFPGLLFPINASISPTMLDLLNPANWGEFLLRGGGPLAVPVLVAEALAFVKTEVSNETLPIPDVEFLFASGSLNVDYGLFLKKDFRIADDAFDAIWGPYKGKHAFGIIIMLNHPESKGYLKLNSADPRDPPKLYPNYLTDPENKDLRTVIAAIRIAQKIAEMPSLARYGSELNLAAVPGCERHKNDSDEFWECQIRHVGTSFWHQVGSCKMGPSSDPEAVVDSKLRVYGMKKLRVADSSVIPRPQAVHSYAPSMLVGQKAAEMILGV